MVVPISGSVSQIRLRKTKNMFVFVFIIIPKGVGIESWNLIATDAMYITRLLYVTPFRVLG